ncbi:hypothetical protein [Veronia pacifica]|uniref:Uncharacterized protein n=1 Tax=Veronia pacifica TaxID=1080227 RepID=A0A1C3EJW6_9GAMM|nr:hypothetical protein [Veronia pacifica]ODA33532.1 hypothetical protein A8L45_10000 [Veronia pacifica]
MVAVSTVGANTGIPMARIQDAPAGNPAAAASEAGMHGGTGNGMKTGQNKDLGGLLGGIGNLFTGGGEGGGNFLGGILETFGNVVPFVIEGGLKLFGIDPEKTTVSDAITQSKEKIGGIFEFFKGVADFIGGLIGLFTGGNKQDNQNGGNAQQA